MDQLPDLLPELRDWNGGEGIAPLDYVYSIATSDSALAYSELFWPRFVEFEGYILRDGFNLENLRSWEKQERRPRCDIEGAINYLGIGDLFTNEEDTELLYRRVVRLGEVLSQTYTAKLRQDFPDRHFDVSLLVDEHEYALTFFQSDG